MFLLKLGLSNLIIISCVLLGRRYPHLGGLIATMPLTSLIVLVWLSSDNPGDVRLYSEFTRGILWGIVPTAIFFTVVYLCLRKGCSLPAAIGFGALFWLVGAGFHQWLLR